MNGDSKINSTFVKKTYIQH